MGNFDDTDKVFEHFFSPKVEPTYRIPSNSHHIRPDSQPKPKDKKKFKSPKEAEKHFSELELSVKELHTTLIKANSPFRFCVYKEGDHVLIDLLRLDKNGGIESTIKKDITHEDFSKCISHIESGEGLFYDHKA